MVSRRRVVGCDDGLSWWQRMVNRPATNSPSNALLWGVAWLIVATILGWHLHLVPMSLVDYDIYGYLPLLWHLAINVVVWITSASLFYLAAVIRNREVQIVELYGRMLFAHWPITLLMLPRLGVDSIDYALLVNDLPAAFEKSAVSATLFALLVIVVIVWYLYWSYQAFSKASQRRGGLTIAMYVCVLYLANKLTMLVLDSVYSGLMN